MNNVVLMGRLTRDPEVRYSQGQNGDQMAIVRFSLAVDRRGKDGGADFISCVCFGKTAEFAEKYLRQGIKVCVNGEIRTGNYTNKDGIKIYTTDINLNNIEFAESKNAEKNTEKTTPAETFESIPDGIENDLPFM